MDEIKNKLEKTKSIIYDTAESQDTFNELIFQDFNDEII